MDEKEKFEKYDKVVNTVVMNVFVEHKRCGKILLWDFTPELPADRLYFNVAAIVADLNKEPIYLNMPFIAYLRFKWKRRKTRKNLRYFGPIQARKLSDDNKTSIYLIMDFVAEQLNITHDFFKEVNDAYYGWVE